ncbi:hypothetical protein HY628_02850 [Candidatus Uhrbacteria bacterium]|nr:hypothetical protein [Candidatus Uhrbacteria bacterium]
MYQSPIPYPYLPPGKQILYVPATDPFMAVAKELCESHTRFCRQPTVAVIVKDHRVIGVGKNGGENPPSVCKRKLLGCKTGEGYELCPGCDPRNHAESSAIAAAPLSDISGADLYLYGHWWCCQPCWEVMTAAGIGNVYLVEGATETFNLSTELSRR